MVKSNLLFGIFSLVALMAIIVTGWRFYQIFVDRDYAIFTTEEEIDSFKEVKFGFFSEYL
ncbi:MAG: hypothetical protein WAV21_03655 [Minisyncoccia bacterium]